jgi:PAS domain S-box-containing protein
MSREVVVSAGRLLVLTCVLVGALTALFDPSPVRTLRLLACGGVLAGSLLALYLLKRGHFSLAVGILISFLYIGSATGAIGSEMGVRAPSLLVLSMFTLVVAFSFRKRVAIVAILGNMAYLSFLFALEKTGHIDPLAHLEALNSTSLFIVLLIATAVFGAMGFPLGQQVDRAMARLKNSRAHLARSREMYRSLVEGAPLGVFNFNNRGHVVYANPLALSWFGLTQRSATGLVLADLIKRALPDSFFSGQGEVLRFDLQISLQDAPDETRWLSVTVSPFPATDGMSNGGVVLMLDDTERKHSELALMAAKDAAETAALAKSRFLSHMSHELRTPMTGILGSVSLARDNRLPAERRERVLGLLNDSAKVMLSLLDEILDATRLSEGRLELHPRPFSPQALLAEMTELYRPAAEGKQLGWFAQWEGPTDMVCVGDPLRLRQVISNLMGNALRFTDAGRIGLRATCAVLPSMTIRLRVEVSDTGIGLTAQQSAHLFQPFTELGLKRAENQRGAGLGLSISKGLLDLMGGQIGVISETGCGSVFWFELALPLSAEKVAA